MTSILKRVLGIATAGATFAAGVASAAPPTWVVEAGDARVYLVGTIHMLPEDADWWSKPFTEVFSDVDGLWLEIDLSSPPDILPLIERYAMAEEDLSMVLGEEDAAILDELLSRFGMDIENFESLQPWFAYLQLAGLMVYELGMDTELGIDLVLMNEAMERDIPVMALEEFEGQFAVLAGLPEAVQIEILRETVLEFDEMAAEMAAELDSWVSGDLQVIEEATVEISNEQPEFYEAVFADRNRGFADGIETILAEGGTNMVAVGLGHFVGPDAIPELLEARGHTVVRWEPEL